MPSTDIWLFGAGGHARSVHEVLRAGGHRLVGVIDPFTRLKTFGGAPVHATLPAIRPIAAALGLGDNGLRARVMEHILEDTPSAQFPVLVHPTASVAEDAVLGPGTVVFAGAIVGAGVHTGCACVINTLAGVDHDGRLGNFVSLAPGALVGGAVTLGNGAFLGMRATVLPGRQIAADVIIGACALVTRDLSEPGGYWGTPARLQKDRAAMAGFLAR